MNSPTLDVLTLTGELIRRASVTPDDAGCQEVLIAHLERLGFTITRLPSGNVTNFWARRGDSAPLIAFAGHTDVVPPGPPEQWTSPPFEPVVRDGFLYGRGAADMKSALAAILVAIERLYTANPNPPGSVGLLITSDEEGDAIAGTVKVIEHLQRSGTHIDYCIVGEPSSRDTVGDMVRVGRRGSLNGRASIRGVQGHVAYPELTRNPIHLAAPAVLELTSRHWDDGNDYFPATTFQISNMHAGTGATNVVPGTLELLFNFRFNTEQTPERLRTAVEEVFARHGLGAEIQWTVSGLPFLTERGRFVDAVCRCIAQVTGQAPELSTAGGTSDGRFIAPTGTHVVEVGVVNQTIHKVDEHVRIADLEALVEIYRRVLADILGS
jgi:succinyl-diaminopimelate desuccinylase